MSGLTNFDPTCNLKNGEYFFDQYKLIIDSVHQLSMARETSVIPPKIKGSKSRIIKSYAA